MDINGYYLPDNNKPPQKFQQRWALGERLMIISLMEPEEYID